MAAGVTTTELRTTGLSGGTSTSAGRWFLEPGQNQLNAQSAPANETKAIRTPMAILLHGKCMPAISPELRSNSTWPSIVVRARRARRTMINAAMKDD
jgi:hypothetical protein